VGETSNRLSVFDESGKDRGGMLELCSAIYDTSFCLSTLLDLSVSANSDISL
jgi:hypothetical protein